MKNSWFFPQFKKNLDFGRKFWKYVDFGPFFENLDFGWNF